MFSELREKNDGELPVTAVSKSKRIEFIWQMCSAMHFMHEKGVFLEELKPKNVLISRHMSVLLSNFKAKPDAAPTDKNDSVKKDIKALALCAYFIFHGKHLDKDATEP